MRCQIVGALTDTIIINKRPFVLSRVPGVVYKAQVSISTTGRRFLYRLLFFRIGLDFLGRDFSLILTLLLSFQHCVVSIESSAHYTSLWNLL